MSIAKQKKKTETAVKKYVKARDNYICQRCLKKIKGSNAHASHVIPVSAGNQYRFDPLNLKCLCYHDHMNWWHKNPIEAALWFIKKFPDRYKYLFGKPKEKVKFTLEELIDMEVYYKRELEKIQSD